MPPVWQTPRMKAVLLLLSVIAAAPALAQIRMPADVYSTRKPPPGAEEEAPAAAPPVNLRPTQLLRCPDGQGGILLQDTPCKPAAPPPGAASASAVEVIDLTQLQPRPQAGAPVQRVEDAGPSRLVKGMLYGAGKVALLLAAVYAVYRIGRYARERFQQRFAQPAPSEAPRRIR